MQGKVYLVGAGPGDPELLTLKAARLIQNADMVVYDRLISQQILDLIDDDTARIYVGKKTSQHTLDQQDINQLLIDLSRRYTHIVRLKGGDPFIYGRGSEEALVLAEAGVTFEVVPGITSAQACASYSGIPLTHRGVARGVQFVTGHWMRNTPLQFKSSVIADETQTLVVYMGLENVLAISEALIKAGRDADTPAAIVEKGTTENHRTTITTIKELPGCVAANHIESPAMLIIGAVVQLAEKLDWFSPGDAYSFSPEKLCSHYSRCGVFTDPAASKIITFRCATSDANA